MLNSERYKSLDQLLMIMVVWEESWLGLEISSKCNLRCPACSQFNILKKDKGHMSLDLFKKIVDDLFKDKIKLKNIDLYFRGESLLNPNFKEMMEYLLEKSKANYPLFGHMLLHTNAELLSEENANAILNICDQSVFEHPGNLFFSIDSATKETYNKVRPGGNFGQVISNIKRIVKMRKKRNQAGPSMVFQFIIQEQNQHEAQLFLDFWALFFKEIKIPFWVDESYGPEIGNVKPTTIYFRRLQDKFININKNIALQKKVIDSLVR